MCFCVEGTCVSEMGQLGTETEDDKVAFPAELSGDAGRQTLLRSLSPRYLQFGCLPAYPLGLKNPCGHINSMLHMTFGAHDLFLQYILIHVTCLLFKFNLRLTTVSSFWR